MSDVVGFVYGEVKPTRFKIMVEDKALAEKGAYIKINHEMYGWVLGQIATVRRFFDPKSNSEKEVASIRVLGYRDDQGIIRLPKTPFKPEERVFKAHETLIKKILGLEIDSTVGLYIGVLDGEGAIKVDLDANRIIQKHLCVLAKTGAGKSYTVGVLLEELAEKGVPCVVIDPHGEYHTLRTPNNNKGDIDKFKKYNVLPKGFQNVVEYTINKNVNPGANREFRLSNKNLNAREIIDVLPVKPGGSQKSLLYQTINELEQGGDYTLEYILQHLQLSDNNAKWGLISSLQALVDWGIFGEAGIKTEELVQKGRTSIINLKGLRPEIQELVVSKIARDVFESRKLGKIPPLLFLIEEAHNFCPERGVGTALSQSVLRTIAAEGRKFGMGLGIVSQRPAKVDKNVLSQCNTQIILKVTNPNDIKAISKSIENFSPELEGLMKSLPMGVAIVSSDRIEQPILVSIRVRVSKHGGESVSVIETGSGEKQYRHKTEQAPASGPKESGEGVLAPIRQHVSKEHVGSLAEKIKGVFIAREGEAESRRMEDAREQVQELKKRKEMHDWEEELKPEDLDMLREIKRESSVKTKIKKAVKSFFIEGGR